MRVAKKTREWMDTIGIRLPVRVINEIVEIAKIEDIKKSAMAKLLVEIGLQAYAKGGERELADLRRKLDDIKEIVLR
jgi:hypothetical protein